MANQYMSMEQVHFLLHEVHDLASVLKEDRYQDYDKEGVDIFLNSMKDLTDKEAFPYFADMDEKPVTYADGKVTVHPQVGVLTAKLAEMGWIGSSFDYDEGGLQMPSMVHLAGAHILEAANNSASGYSGLTEGAAKLIVSFGSKDLFNTYVPNMLSGKWMGTMALTEPQAGSSLSDITSSATPQEDGNYKIKGQKIFISGGDHQFGENFVHLTLARIDGAPSGTKGISLFVVPKHRPTTDGGLEYNDVYTAGDFQKMGQKGYATTHLSFGDNDDCVGFLVGQPNKGLRYMFQMMNGARIAVGLGGTSMATAAYYASLQYAKERPQGRKLTSTGRKDVSKGQTLIINHPDVRRMLLLQKSVCEGSLSLLMECVRYADLIKTTTDEKTKANYQLLLEILTPIAKTYPSEMGQVSISNGLQVLGGYGFCTDFPLQQYYRDVRIAAIYEGTTGIQSLDLLGRKITMQGGKALMLLSQEMQQTIASAMTHADLKPYAKALGAKLGEVQEVLHFLMGFAQEGDFQRYLSDATLFMEFFSTITVAWQWLKMGVFAKQALVTGQKAQSVDFYESKLHTMKFYFKYELPKTLGLMQSIMDEEVLTIMTEKELTF